MILREINKYRTYLMVYTEDGFHLEASMGSIRAQLFRMGCVNEEKGITNWPNLCTHPYRSR